MLTYCVYASDSPRQSMLSVFLNCAFNVKCCVKIRKLPLENHMQQINYFNFIYMLMTFCFTDHGVMPCLRQPCCSAMVVKFCCFFILKRQAGLPMINSYRITTSYFSDENNLDLISEYGNYHTVDSAKFTLLSWILSYPSYVSLSAQVESGSTKFHKPLFFLSNLPILKVISFLRQLGPFSIPSSKVK